MLKVVVSWNESRMSSNLTCPVCSSTHRSAQALWKHKLLHSGDKINCSNFDTCGYASVYIADVRVHEARCGKSVDDKDWECHCGSQFTMKQNWQKHLRKNPTHQLIRNYHNSLDVWPILTGQPEGDSKPDGTKRKRKEGITKERKQKHIESSDECTSPSPPLEKTRKRKTALATTPIQGADLLSIRSWSLPQIIIDIGPVSTKVMMFNFHAWHCRFPRDNCHLSMQQQLLLWWQS